MFEIDFVLEIDFLFNIFATSQRGAQNIELRSYP